MADTAIPCTYFGQPGKDNTAWVLQIARGRADELGIRSIVVATTTGQTGVRAAEVFTAFFDTRVEVLCKPGFYASKSR